jgi:predicted dehydrogenase
LFEYDNGVTGQYITSTGEAPGTNRLEIACDMGRLIIEDKKDIVFDRNVISEREHNKTNDKPFSTPECWKCDIPVAGGVDEQHVKILRNFADAILNGAELIAKGEDGILGLTISNAIHLSSWTGEFVDVKNFPSEKFYNILQEKIAASTVVKKESNVITDISNTH